MIKRIFQKLGILTSNSAKIEGCSKVTINGKTFVGSTVEVVNDKVTIDGKPVNADCESYKTINITVEGNCGHVTVQVGDVTVKGSVDGEVHTGMGNIECGDVTGSVDNSMGDIVCGNVGGDVSDAMGNISCRDVKGDASASMGNIYKGR
jgi:hypothetical protein